MKKFNVKEVFDRYTENEKLIEADIFHLYDIGKECFKDNSGFDDSRHFELVVFNTKTMEKKNYGWHDGIRNFSKVPAIMFRVYADGSFFIRFKRPVLLNLFQEVYLGSWLNNP